MKAQKQYNDASRYNILTTLLWRTKEEDDATVSYIIMARSKRTPKTNGIFNCLSISFVAAFVWNFSLTNIFRPEGMNMRPLRISFPSYIWDQWWWSLVEYLLLHTTLNLNAWTPQFVYSLRRNFYCRNFHCGFAMQCSENKHTHTISRGRVLYGGRSVKGTVGSKWGVHEGKTIRIIWSSQQTSNYLQCMYICNLYPSSSFMPWEKHDSPLIQNRKRFKPSISNLTLEKLSHANSYTTLIP